MKTYRTLLIALLTLQSMAVQSQTIENQPKPTHGLMFFRIYPLELVVHELRLGVEIPTAPRQAVVLDGSYFWGSGSNDNSILREGLALKMDYRFYLADPQVRTRFFVGPNLMIKGQQYNRDVYYNTSSSGPTYTTDSRMIYCGNIKAGFDIQLARTDRTRLEIFSGVGYGISPLVKT